MVSPANPILPLASVVVVGYQSRADLDRCFAALLAQRLPEPFEVLFVDNASTDGSAAHVRAAFPAVRVVEAGANLGYAAGNNLGAARATGRFLVFLNPDTEAAPGWLAALLRPLRADPTVGLTTSKIVLLSDPATVNACGNEIALSGITWCRGAGRPARDFAEDADVPAVSGCAFAIPADLFRRLGGFDPAFFMYLEDTDLSWRARVAGYRCRFVAGSVVAHDYRLALGPAKIGRIERNRYRMLGKHLSRRALVALLPALAVGEALAWGYALTRGPGAVAAKARATAWAFTRLGPVLRTPSTAAERRVLAAHAPSPAVVGEVGGPVGRATQVALRPLADLSAAFARRCLGLPLGGGTPAAPRVEVRPQGDAA